MISRYSAHHWQSITQAIDEIYRVLRADGKVILFDIIGNSNPILDTFIQTIETQCLVHVLGYLSMLLIYFDIVPD